MKCDYCGKEMEKENFDLFDTGITTSGWICKVCNNVRFDQEEAKYAIESMKALEEETPLLTLKRKISQLSENRIGIYLPNDLIRSLELKKDEEIEIYPVDRKTIVIRRISENI